MQVVNHNGIGNPNHDDSTGQFVSSGESSGASSEKEAITTSSGSMPSWLKKAGTTTSQASTTNSNIPSWLKKQDNQQQGQPANKSAWQKVAEEKWFRSGKVLTEDELVDNFERFIDEDTTDFLEKYGDYHTCDYMGAGKTSHAHLNKPLLNAIAKKRWVHGTALPASEFDKIYKNIASGWGRPSANEHNKYNRFQRGFNNRDRIKEFIGEKDVEHDVFLPAGMLGSCQYTAFDGHTAQSYGNIVMSMYMDMSKAKSIDYNDAVSLNRKLLSRMPEFRSKIASSMKKLGKSQDKIDRLCRNLENCLTHDPTTGAIFMGYDAVINHSYNYYLALNYRNVYAREDW